jgi:hypothetical protein
MYACMFMCMYVGLSCLFIATQSNVASRGGFVRMYACMYVCMYVGLSCLFIATQSNVASRGRFDRMYACMHVYVYVCRLVLSSCGDDVACGQPRQVCSYVCMYVYICIYVCVYCARTFTNGENMCLYLA